jgi:PPM family protein phosphatase
LKAGSWVYADRGLEVRVRCEQGARRRIEDAWVADLDVPHAGGRAAVFAVFDGLGGEPGGDVAARTASSELVPTIRAATAFPEVLPRLNSRVLTSGGFTTAVVALLEPETGRVDLASVGDSGAFMLEDGRVRLVSERDSAPSGSITDFLGNAGLRGHRSTLQLDRGASLILCTDGVDGVIGAAALRPLLEASMVESRAALDRVYEEITRRGAPDNATLVWVRRA